jgi:TetR/AcrR family transcriptional repressor of mexJK operon
MEKCMEDPDSYTGASTMWYAGPISPVIFITFPAKDRTLAQARDPLPSPSNGKAGRPKDHAKHQAIIAAAKQLFVSLPFDMVTMEAVAAQAGVSKMTVYSHFHDKETLFETIVSATTDAMIGALPEPQTCGATHDRLVAIGIAFLRVVLGSDVCRMAHTLPETLRENRHLAVRFYAAGPARVRAALATIITTAAGRGELAVDDADLAADDLVSLWEGGVPDKIAYGLADILSPAEIEWRATRGTAIFLRAYRNTAAAASRCGPADLDSPTPPA